MTHPTARDRVLLACLLAVAGGLLAVGLVSGTEVRHLIQSAPAILVAALAARRDPRARFAALPVFTVWFLIMLLIWLFLLGISRIVTGHFTPAEIVLTLVIGGACIAGLFRTVRGGPRIGWVMAAVTLLVSSALQVGCLWLSL